MKSPTTITLILALFLGFIFSQVFTVSASSQIDAGGPVYLPVVVRPGSTAEGAIIADHTAVAQFSSIPSEWVQQAKQNVQWAYGHSSHGSQVVSGLVYLDAQTFPLKYDFLFENTLPLQTDPLHLLMSNQDGWYWGSGDFLGRARSQLDASPEATSFMWSWCGDLSAPVSSGIVNQYLGYMNQLESEYPGVRFVYMTGHTDGTGVDGNLNQNNNLIRDYVRENGKVLFDFADIETWDPAGNYYPDTNDGCPWCANWCSSHPDECVDLPSCAHSHGLNCKLKGEAFWWLSARLAGWGGN